MGEGLPALPSLVFGTEVLGLDRAEAPLGHDAPDSGRGADDATIGEIFTNAPVTVAFAMVPENRLDEVANLGIRGLGRGWCGGVIKAAPKLPGQLANFADTASDFLCKELDHRAAPI